MRLRSWGGGMAMTALIAVDRLERRQLFSGTATDVSLPPMGSSTVVQLTHLPLDSRYFSPIDPTAFDGDLYYLAPDTSTTSPTTLLWRSDGTVAGTTPIAENGIAVTGGTSMAAGANALYVVSTTTLYKLDGTTLTTVPLPATDTWNVLGVVAGRAYLMQGSSASAGAAGELWSTDGTVAGTHDLGRFTVSLAANVRGAAPQSTSPANEFFFSSGSTVYVTDGQAAGTTAVYTASGDIDSLVASGSKAYFTTTDRAFYVTDGTAAGTHQLLAGPFGAYANLTAGPNGSLFLYATAPSHIDSQTLYYTDGTVDGTVDLGTADGIYPANQYHMLTTAGDGKAYFVGESQAAGAVELYTSDGTVAGTTPVVDLGTDGGGEHDNYVPDGDGVYLLLSHVPVGSEGMADGQLYVSDGTARGTVEVGTGVPQGTLTSAAGKLFITTPNYESTDHVAPGQLLAYTISTATGLTPTVTSSSVPAAVITGYAIGGSVRVTLRNTTPVLVPANFPTVVQVYATTDGTIDGNSMLLGQVAKPIRLGAGKATMVAVRVRSTFTTAGTYALVARTTDATGYVGVSPAGPMVVASSPTVTLSTTVTGVRPGMVAAAAGRVATVSVTVTNAGNTTAVGDLSLAVSLQTDGAEGTATLVDPPRKLTVRAGGSVRLRLRFRVPAAAPAGTYEVTVPLQLGDSFATTTTAGAITVA